MKKLLILTLPFFLIIGVSPKIHGAEKKVQIVQRAWTKALKGGSSKKKYYPEAAVPSVAENRILVGSHSSIFYSVDAAQRGKILWQYKTNGPIASQASADSRAVYFGNNKGTVYALDLATGSLLWESFVGGEVLAQPALTAGSVYVVTSSREVYALDSETGKEKWSQYIKGYDKKVTVRGNSPILVSGGRLFVAFSDGQVISLLAGEGSLIWSRNLVDGNPVFKDIDASLLEEGAFLYAAGYFGYLVKLGKNSGDTVWKKEIKGGAEMAFDGDTLYLSLQGGTVAAFDKSDGVKKWEVPLEGGILSPPERVGDILLVGSDKGNAFVLNPQNGKMLQKIPLNSGWINDAFVKNSTLYFLSSSAKLVALQKN